MHEEMNIEQRMSVKKPANDSYLWVMSWRFEFVVSVAVTNGLLQGCILQDDSRVRLETRPVAPHQLNLHAGNEIQRKKKMVARVL